MPRILVVEADADFAAKIRDTLKHQGVEVQMVADGMLALSSAVQFAPDAIVLRVELPGKNGYSICTELKRHPELANTPLIISSSAGSPEVFAKHRNLRTHAEEYLVQPFPMKDLVAALAPHVRLPSAEGEEEILIEDLGDEIEIEDVIEDEIEVGDPDLEIEVQDGPFGDGPFGVGNGPFETTDVITRGKDADGEIDAAFAALVDVASPEAPPPAAPPVALEMVADEGDDLVVEDSGLYGAPTDQHALGMKRDSSGALPTLERTQVDGGAHSAPSTTPAPLDTDIAQFDESGRFRDPEQDPEPLSSTLEVDAMPNLDEPTLVTHNEKELITAVAGAQKTGEAAPSLGVAPEFAQELASAADPAPEPAVVSEPAPAPAPVVTLEPAPAPAPAVTLEPGPSSEQVHALEAELSDIKARYEEAAASLEAMRGEAQEAKAELARAEERAASTEARVVSAEERAESAEKRVVNAKGRAESAEKRVVGAEERAVSAEERVTVAEEHLAKAGTTASSTNYSRDREVLSLKEVINKKEKETLDLRDDLDGKDRQILDHKDKVRELERKARDVEEKLLTTERELVAINERCDALGQDKERAQDREHGLKKRLTDAKGEVQKSHGEVAELKEQTVQEREQFQQQHTAALEASRTENEQAQTRLEEEFGAKVAAVEAQATGREEDLRAEREVALADRDRQHAEALAERDAAHEQGLQMLRDEHQGVLAARTAEQAAALQAQHEEHQGELNAQGGEHQQSMEALRREHEAALHQQREEQQEALAEQESKQAAALERHEAEAAGQKESLRAEHQSEVDRLRGEHHRVLEATRRKSEATLAQTQQTYEEKQQQQQQSYEAELEGMRGEHAAKVVELEEGAATAAQEHINALQEAEQTRQQERQELEHTISTHKADGERLRTDLEHGRQAIAERDTQISDLEVQIASYQEQLMTAFNRMQTNDALVDKSKRALSVALALLEQAGENADAVSAAEGAEQTSAAPPLD
ncbi:MAG: response regulator [Deltaproteobacteria bacterium]|nr:response regulator [Deltaproteobacteria bacterium]